MRCEDGRDLDQYTPADVDSTPAVPGENPGTAGISVKDYKESITYYQPSVLECESNTCLHSNHTSGFEF